MGWDMRVVIYDSPWDSVVQKPRLEGAAKDVALSPSELKRNNQS